MKNKMKNKMIYKTLTICIMIVAMTVVSCRKTDQPETNVIEQFKEASFSERAEMLKSGVVITNVKGEVLDMETLRKMEEDSKLMQERDDNFEILNKVLKQKESWTKKELIEICKEYGMNNFQWEGYGDIAKGNLSLEPEEAQISCEEYWSWDCWWSGYWYLLKKRYGEFRYDENGLIFFHKFTRVTNTCGDGC